MENLQKEQEKYFKEKGLEYKESGDKEFILKTCVFCGDSAFHHFYLSRETSQYHCKKCLATGNLNTLRAHFGDAPLVGDWFPEAARLQLGIEEPENKRPERPKKEYRELKYDLPMQYAAKLWAGSKYLDYLKNQRGLAEQVIKDFKLGDTGLGISIPIYEDYKLINIRYRKDPALDGQEGSRYSQEKDCRAALFNGDILKEASLAIISEGEFDAMCLISQGFKNVVSVTLGAGSFLEEWVPLFKDLKQIVVIFDSDEAGKKGAKSVSEKLGVHRCRIVDLPKVEGRKKTDITNYFVDDKHTKDEFIALIKAAKSAAVYDSEEIKHISEFNEELRKMLLGNLQVGEPTGFKNLDEAVGGLRKGRLIIIAGITSTGKSTLASNMTLRMAERGKHVFYFSLEMPPIDIAKKILMLKARMSGADLSNVKNPSAELDCVDATLSGFKTMNGSGLPIYLYNGSGTVKYAIFEKCARAAKEEFGIECIFIDHLHYFAMNYGNLTAETAMVVRAIKQLAIALDIPIVLLAHLNRAGRVKQKTSFYVPSLSDLLNTGAIEQESDQVLFICRDAESEDKAVRSEAAIKIAKNRDGRVGQSIDLEFDEDIGHFEEVDRAVNLVQQKKEEQKAMKSELPDVPSNF